MKRWVYLLFIAALILGGCSSTDLGLSESEAQTEMPVSEMLIATVAALNDVGTMPPSTQDAVASDPSVVLDPSAVLDPSVVPDTSTAAVETAEGVNAGQVDTPQAGTPQEVSLVSPGTTQLKTAKPVYMLQPGSLIGVPNFVFPEAGCNWVGVGGQVFDSAGTPVKGLIVEVMGMLEGKDVLLLAMTGSSTSLGPGGYLLSLADHPVQTADTLYVQVYDQNGAVVSNQVQFAVNAQCEQNLILVNFTQTVLDKFFFIPNVPRENNQSFLPNVQGN